MRLQIAKHVLGIIMETNQEINAKPIEHLIHIIIKLLVKKVYILARFHKKALDFFDSFVCFVLLRNCVFCTF